MFSIYRSPTAVMPLREVWEQADEALRQAITQASYDVNRRLHHDPHGEGESREGRTRILFEAPVGVLYEIDEEKRLVNVLSSWTFRTSVDVQDKNE